MVEPQIFGIMGWAVRSRIKKAEWAKVLWSSNGVLKCLKVAKACPQILSQNPNKYFIKTASVEKN